MVIATLAAFLVVIFPPEHHAEFPEALAVMFFYQIGEMCQEYALNKSKRSIEHLMKLKPQTVNLLAGVTTTIVKVEDVKVGDIILVHPGEEIPLDGVVLDGNSSLDTVNLTGEVFPRSVQINDQVLSGSVNLINAIKIKVSSAFKDSTIMRILQVVEKATESKSRSETLIHRFAKWYTPLVVIIAILVAIIPPLSINLHSGNVWFT
jgi:Cd2+/Zn2+-exporting ATPase